MARENEEREIRELLNQAPREVPPGFLLADYEKRVWERIEREVARRARWRGLGFVLLVTAAVGLAAALVLFPSLNRPKAFEPEISGPVLPGVEPRRLEGESLEMTEEMLFREMTDDLFILEMLGEAEKLMDDTDLIQGDLDFFEQVASEAAG